MFASLSPHSARSQYRSPLPWVYTNMKLFLNFIVIFTLLSCRADHTTTTDLCLNILEKILFNRLERNWVEACLKSVDAVYQPGLREALVSLSSFTCKEIPKYCENKSELVSKLRKLNSIFRKSKRAVFRRPSCDKRQILVELVQSKAQALPI